jgi:hypothetical protein
MVGIAVKWFPDRRGLAVGLTAAGFGAGAALTVIPIADMIKHSGYGAAFQAFGLIQGALVFLVAFFLRFPDAEQTALLVGSAQNTVAITRRRRNSYTPWQMLSSPQFWVLYVMFVMIATGLRRSGSGRGRVAGSLRWYPSATMMRMPKRVLAYDLPFDEDDLTISSAARSASPGPKPVQLSTSCAARSSS